MCAQAYFLCTQDTFPCAWFTFTYAQDIFTNAEHQANITAAIRRSTTAVHAKRNHTAKWLLLKIILYNDASSCSIGAVLSQMHEEKAIAYASSNLQVAQQCYCVMRCKLLTVVRFIMQFSYYLLGHCFLLWTNLSRLSWLFHFKQPEVQWVRRTGTAWLLKSTMVRHEK